MVQYDFYEFFFIITGPNDEVHCVQCENTEFGCCPDDETPARGPDFEGKQ